MAGGVHRDLLDYLLITLHLARLVDAGVHLEKFPDWYILHTRIPIYGPAVEEQEEGQLRRGLTGESPSKEGIFYTKGPRAFSPGVPVLQSRSTSGNSSIRGPAHVIPQNCPHLSGRNGFTNECSPLFVPFTKHFV